MSESQLADPLYTVAAAVSPPRRSGAQNKAQERGMRTATDRGEVLVNSQSQARSVFVELLREWKARSFSCSSISCILNHLHGQKAAFEEKAGDLRSAGQSAQWLAIQEAIEKLLQNECATSPSCSSRCSLMAQRKQC